MGKSKITWGLLSAMLGLFTSLSLQATDTTTTFSIPSESKPVDAPAVITHTSFQASTSLDASWLAKVQEDIAQQEYHISETDKGLQAPNRAQNIRTYFSSGGIKVQGRSSEDATPLVALQYVGLQREDQSVQQKSNSSKPIYKGSRVEIRHGDAVTEWFENTTAGLEQGFTLHKRPVGQGLITLSLDVSHATPELKGGRIQLKTEIGRTLNYDKLKVFDAEGKQLAAHFKVSSGQQIKIAFNDEQAVYPVIIDPLLSSADWSVESNHAGSQFGNSVATGDVNGDGYDDVLIGAPYADSGYTDTGHVVAYLGSSTGLMSAPHWVVGPNASILAGARFGADLAVADVNGDGYDDVIVAAPGSGGYEFNGGLFLFLGSSSGLQASIDWTNAIFYNMFAQGQGYGSNIASAGDVNGDGYEDVITGSVAATVFDSNQNYYHYAGIATVKLGSSTEPLSTGVGWTLEPIESYAFFGNAAGGAGDVNGDGYDDVLVGAAGLDTFYLFFGSSTGVSTSPAWQVDGVDSGRAAGDINGDGYGDVVVGAGTLYLGSNTGLSNTPFWQAPVAGSVSRVGDLNNDGYDDVVIGDSKYDIGTEDTNEGAAYVYLGSSTGLSSNPYWQVIGDQPGVRLGWNHTNGDFNGDGYDEVIVSAPYYDNGETDEGAVYAFVLNSKSYKVTPSADAGGSINPNTVQTVGHGKSITFTLTPNTGYIIDKVQGCSGTLSGNTYTTGPILADCSVSATFKINPDADNDGTNDDQDNCPAVPNPSQADYDKDGIGDACDDSDKDGLTDQREINTYSTAPAKSDTDGDGHSDKDEVVSGSDPLDAKDQPKSSIGVLVFPLGDELVVVPFSKEGDILFNYDPNSPVILSGELDDAVVTYLGSKDAAGVITDLSSIIINSDSAPETDLTIDFDASGRLSKVISQDGSLTFDYSTAGQVAVTVTDNAGASEVITVDAATLQSTSLSMVGDASGLMAVSPKSTGTSYQIAAETNDSYLYDQKYGDITVSCDDSHSDEYIETKSYTLHGTSYTKGIPKNLKIALEVGNVAKFLVVNIDPKDDLEVAKPKSSTKYRYGWSFLTQIPDYDPWRSQCLKEKGIAEYKHLETVNEINDWVKTIEGWKSDKCLITSVEKLGCSVESIPNLLKGALSGALGSFGSWLNNEDICTTEEYSKYEEYMLDVQKDVLLVGEKTYRSGVYEELTPIRFNLLATETLPTLKFDAEPPPTGVALRVLKSNPEDPNKEYANVADYQDFGATEMTDGLQVTAGDKIYFKALDNFFDQTPVIASQDNRFASQNYACADYQLQVTRNGVTVANEAFTNANPVIDIPYTGTSDDGFYKARLTITNANTESPIVVEKTFRIGTESCSYVEQAVTENDPDISGIGYANPTGTEYLKTCNNASNVAEKRWTHRIMYPDPNDTSFKQTFLKYKNLTNEAYVYDDIYFDHIEAVVPSASLKYFCEDDTSGYYVLYSQDLNTVVATYGTRQACQDQLMIYVQPYGLVPPASCLDFWGHTENGVPVVCQP